MCEKKFYFLHFEAESSMEASENFFCLASGSRVVDLSRNSHIVTVVFVRHAMSILLMLNDLFKLQICYFVAT